MENSGSINNNINNNKLNVGIIVPPNKFYKPTLYSHEEASRNFKKLNHDIYESQKKAKSITEKETPKSVFVALGVIGLACCYPLIRKIFKH